MRYSNTTARQQEHRQPLRHLHRRGRVDGRFSMMPSSLSSSPSSPLALVTLATVVAIAVIGAVAMTAAPVAGEFVEVIQNHQGVHSESQHARPSHHETSGSAGGGHQCLHDHIMDMVAKAAESAGDPHPFDAQAELAEPPPPLAEGRRLQASYSPIRITLKLDFLQDSVDSTYVCESASDTFVEGTGTATSLSDTTGCTAADVMLEGDDKYNFLVNQVLRDAVDFFETSLSVIPVSGNLALPYVWPYSSCFPTGLVLPFVCCETILPSEAISPGIPNSDFVLYITKRPTIGSTLAYALPCQQDNRAGSTGRPTLGQANFSPARISTDPSLYSEQLSTAIHEIAHALGFTNSKFSAFIDPTTGSTIPRSSVVSSYTDTKLNKFVNKIITPNVVQAVKDHFGCTNWPDAGAELEDFGGSGTAGSHWEKRILFNEYMTGTADPNSVYSAITLALFEDTGWYQVDYSAAQSLPWGNNQGCDFVRETCGAGWNNRYFCSTVNEEGCTVDLRYRAICSVQQGGATVPSSFQYFSDPTKAGSSAYVDYCPYYTRVSGSDCRSASTRGFWHYGEKSYPGGSNVRCFSGTFVFNGISSPQRHAACLDFTCNAQSLIEATLQGLSGQTTVVTCPAAGGAVDVSTIPGSQFIGTFDCPPKETLCTGDPCDLNDCDGHGNCDSSTGECTCYSGFYGDDVYSCDKRTCPEYEPGNQCGTSSDPMRGTCDTDTGLCVCEEGFKGTSCEAVGCPEVDGVECTSAERGTCEPSGACNCSPGFIGPACQRTDCPGSPRCTSTERGTCDEENGICTCFDDIDPTTAQPLYYTGAACDVKVEDATRPVPVLNFFGEDNPSGGTYSTVSATLEPKVMSYFVFNVPSTNFPITLTVTPTVTARLPELEVVADYEDSAQYPSLANHEFSTEPVAAGATAQKILFVAASDAGAQTPFNRVGNMRVSVVATGEIGFDVVLKLSRSGCAVITCENGGTCANGLCTCAQQLTPGGYLTTWSGDFCEAPDCPGTPDCNGRGTCEVVSGSSFPKCTCSGFYSGDACESADIPGASTIVNPFDPATLIPISSPPGTPPSEPRYESENEVRSNDKTGVALFGKTTGTVPVGTQHVVALQFNMSMSLLVRLESHSPEADPMLLSNRNEPATLSVYDQFDLSSWTSKRNVHQIATTVTPGFTFVTVLNSRYGLDTLDFTLYYEAAERCPPSLTFATNSTSPLAAPRETDDACTGHGDPLAYCSNPNNVPNAGPQLCSCVQNYEGAYCNVEAQVITSGSTEFATGLQPGQWKYFMYQAPSSIKQLSLSASRTSVSTRSEMLMIVGRTDRRSANALDSIQSSALFDFDGYTSRSVTQSLNITRSINLGPRNTEFFYIGIYNTANARAALDVALTFTAHSDFTVTCPASGAARTECLADSAETACHGRGIATGGETAESVDCACNTGWNRRTYCASPKVFNTFSNLLEATQNLEFMCNVCEFENSLDRNAVRFFKVPQPLQKATGLVLRTTNSTIENATLGNPSLMVSPYLPRSIADFTFVSSSSSELEVVSLEEPSPTGDYFVALYANSVGNYHMLAERSALGGGGVEDDVFIKELATWLGTTSVGNVTLVIGILFILCVCMGCVCQHVECHNCRPKRREEKRLAESRNLGLFSVNTPELVAGHKERVQQHHQQHVQDALSRRAPDRPKSDRPASDAIQRRLQLEMARLDAERRATMSNPMSGGGYPGSSGSGSPINRGSLSPAGVVVGQSRTPSQSAGFSRGAGGYNQSNEAKNLPPSVPIMPFMPDGSLPPPPPPSEGAPRSLQLRLRSMRAGSMSNPGGAQAILGPRTDPPPPPPAI